MRTCALAMLGVSAKSVDAKSSGATSARSADASAMRAHPETLAITGAVYQTAAPNTLPTPVNLGNVRVGGTLSTNLSIQNTASGPAGFVETLGASVTGTTGGVQTAGTVSNLAAGATSTAISAGFSTATAGARSGSATIGFTTNEVNGSGLGTAGIGSQTHLAAENFVNAAKFNALSVPYKGEGPSLIGLIGGETTFLVTNLAAALSHINGGKLRALGVTSKVEAPQLPGVPPIAKTLPGFENAGWFGIVAPTGTANDIVQKIYRDTKKALEATDLKARLYVQGLAPVGNTPEQMGRAMKEETALWARVVKERQIRVK